MSVLDRSELEASPLADLHAIADQLGLDGFRRLRKAELIGAILGEPGKEPTDGNAQSSGDSDRDTVEGESEGGPSDWPSPAPSKTVVGGDAEGGARRRRGPRLRRGAKEQVEGSSAAVHESSTSSSSTSSRRGDGAGKRDERGGRDAAQQNDRSEIAPSKTGLGDTAAAGDPRSAEGVVELLGNGSAFLRVDPPEPSDEDVYISAAQVRRCELISGDRVTGPVRTPRRSERYPSLVRIDTINGASAEKVSEGAGYEDLAVAYPSKRFALNAEDPTLDAIEWLTPLGRGSRAVIVGPPRVGKTETLRRLLRAVVSSPAAGGGSEALAVTVVLAGARPEEIAEWQEGSVPPSPHSASPPRRIRRARRSSARWTAPSASPLAGDTRWC